MLDLWILDAIEALCQRWQRLTGRTNVWVAVQLTNLSIVVYFVWAGMYFWRRDLGSRVFIASFCVGVLYLLTQTVFRVSIEASEQNAYRRVARGLRNPRRVRDAMLRILFLTLSALLIAPAAGMYAIFDLSIALSTYSLILLTTVLLYVVACDPLPPCEGTVTSWLRRPAASSAAPSLRDRTFRLFVSVGEHPLELSANEPAT